MAANSDNVEGNVPIGSGAPGSTEQKSSDAKNDYLTNKTNPEHRELANIEDFYFNAPAHIADDERSVLGHVYDRIDKEATPLSTSIDNSKATDQAYRDTITKIFKDKKTEHFKYGIYIDDMHNEDPTVLGFDLMIDVNNSPLFSELPEFFKAFNGVSEISNRKDVYEQFIKELTAYFETTTPGATNEFSAFKSHYIQSVSGLDTLVESISGGSFEESGKKQFTDYGKDLLKLKLYEDVTLSTSHLALLYKTLSWSRINGRLIIPENLLRFDMYVQVSEIRNFNTVRKNIIGGSGGELLSVVRANVSRYVYKLYDCQFFFDKLPHTDSVDVNQNKFTETFDISIKYKFSTVQFERFMQQDDVINRALGAGPNDLKNRTDSAISRVDANNNPKEPYMASNNYISQYRKYVTNEDIYPTNVNLSGYGGATASDPNMGDKAEFLIKKNPISPMPYIWFDVVSPTQSTRSRAQDQKNKSGSDDEINKKTSGSNSALEQAKNKSNSNAQKQSFGDKLKTTLKKEGTSAIDGLKKASLALAQNQANQLIGLVNQSFNKILAKAGLGKGVYDPSNVYDKVNPIEQLIKSQFRKFGNSTINSVLGLGQSELKNLFKK